MVQLTLKSGLWGKREALDLLDRRYDEWLSRVGVPALVTVAQEQELFTADDVWRKLVDRFAAEPRERRVLGVVFRRAYKAGLIVKTSVYVQSSMPECHAREKLVWRSLLFKNGTSEHDRETAPVIPGSGDE